MLIQTVVKLLTAYCNTYELKPNTSFDIICVNLASEAKRRDHLERMLQYAQCKYRIFSAVDGKALLSGVKSISECTDLGNYTAKHMHISRKFFGAFGLKATSLIIYREIEKSGSDRPVLILEDDVDLEADFVAEIERMLSRMTDEWDISLLSSVYYNDGSRLASSHTGLKGINFFSGTYAYLVNGARAAGKLARLLENCPPEDPIDFYFGKLSTSKHIHAYAFSRRLATHLGDVFESVDRDFFFHWS